MGWLKRYLIILLSLSLLTVPINVQGAEKNREAVSVHKNISTSIKTVTKAKKNMDTVPADYPLVTDGGHVGVLEDDYGYHYITFQSISDYTDSTMDFQILYESDNYYSKDPIVTMEFYSDENGSLEHYGNTEFDTYGENDLYLHSYIPKSDFVNQEYIYVRMGISASSDDQYYTDVLLFKVENPYYSEPSNPDPQPGKYVIISNESVNADQLEYTGSFKINNNKYALNKKLGLESYKMDFIKPFNVEKNRSKLVNSKSYSRKLSSTLGDTKSFWVDNLVTGNTEQISAQLAYSGIKANVWVYNNLITTQDANKLGSEFDAKIYPSVTNNFAKESDVDGDGKINILCYDIQDGFSGSGGYVAGYFNPGDLFNLAQSNQSEIFYIDTYPTMGVGSTDVSGVYGILAHEFQHMVNFNQKVLIQGNDFQTDTWLDEGLSMAAEQIYSGNALTDQINYYNYTNSTTSGHSLLYWDYYGDVLANYSLSYLFSQYVKLQANRGNAIFKDIILDSNTDYKSVENVVKKYIAPSMSFGKFMTDFRAALLLKQDTGLYGFKGVSDFDQVQAKLYSGSALDLKGGGAVAEQIDPQNFEIPANRGADITYTIFDDTSVADTTPPVPPTVNTVGDTDTIVKGVAEAYSTVTVKLGSTILGSNNADSKGNFSVPITKQEAGTKLTVYAEDAAKNKSPEVVITVIHNFSFTVTSNYKSPQIERKTITFQADSTASGLQYQFSIQGKVVQKFSSVKTYKWTPTTPGTYKIIGEARDPSFPNAVQKKEITYSITAYKPDFSITSFSPTIKSPYIIGKTIKFTAKTNKPSLQYQFSVNSRVVQKFGSKTYYSWKPSKAGRYNVKVEVRRSQYPNRIVSKQISYEIQDGKVSISSLKASVSSPRPVSTSIKWTAAARGVNLEYKFSVYQSKKWIIIKNYSSKNYVYWKPKSAGSYKVKVYARSKASGKSNTKQVSYTIFKPSSFSITSFSVNKKSPIKTGTSLHFNANSKGSYLEYKYNIYDGHSWYTYKDYSKSKTLDWTPYYDGKYKVMIYARQVGTSKVKTKTISIDVRESPNYYFSNYYNMYYNYGTFTAYNYGYSNLTINKIQYMNSGSVIYTYYPDNWIFLGRTYGTFYYYPSSTITRYNYYTYIKVYYTFDGLSYTTNLY